MLTGVIVVSALPHLMCCVNMCLIPALRCASQVEGWLEEETPAVTT